MAERDNKRRGGPGGRDLLRRKETRVETREVWAIAVALISAARIANTMDSASPIEKEYTMEQRNAVATKVAEECSTWQIESALSIFKRAYDIKVLKDA